VSPSQQPGGAAAGPLINFLVAYEGGHHLRAPLTDGFSPGCNCAATGAACGRSTDMFVFRSKLHDQRAIPRHQRQALRPVRRVG